MLAGETLSTDAAANPKGGRKSLCGRVRSTKVLLAAWHEIRRNAETSRTASTRQKAREFARDLPRNLRNIQSRLRRGYQFDKAYGALPPKGAGKTGKRPIVVAPIEDRIVQRAILDVLQDATEISAVQDVLATPTSIGGIRGRGVDHAISIFQDSVDQGHRFVAGSDIAGFFTKISVPEVMAFLRSSISEAEFTDLVERALTVELVNASKLSPDDRKLFPTGGDGVAQGCPLSALAGNIALRDFDALMNDPARGVTCVRYIDDFIITGATSRKVLHAMKGAGSFLSAKRMKVYDPVKRPTKAFSGKIGEPHVFLGYELVPGEYFPSLAAEAKLLRRVRELIEDGKTAIRKAVSGRPVRSNDRCYAQTIDAINHALQGWRGSFRSTLSMARFAALDAKVERLLTDSEYFFRTQTASGGPHRRRRALGVCLLSEP